MQLIVFVIGAGAGKEVNLPAGQELKRSIIDILPKHMRYPGQLSDETVTFNLALERHCSGTSNAISLDRNKLVLCC